MQENQATGSAWIFRGGNVRFGTIGFWLMGIITGHLLLGKRADGRYILGVPGRYDQQEQFMAACLGFLISRKAPASGCLRDAEVLVPFNQCPGCQRWKWFLTEYGQNLLVLQRIAAESGLQNFLGISVCLEIVSFAPANHQPIASKSCWV